MRHIDLCQYFNYLVERVIERQKKDIKVEVAEFLRKYKRDKYSSYDAIIFIDQIRDVIDERYAQEVDEKIHDMKADLELERVIDEIISTDG